MLATRTPPGLSAFSARIKIDRPVDAKDRTHLSNHQLVCGFLGRCVHFDHDHGQTPGRTLANFNADRRTVVVASPSFRRRQDALGYDVGGVSVDAGDDVGVAIDSDGD